MNCPKCNATAFKPIEDDYILCITCGKHIDTEKPQPIFQYNPKEEKQKATPPGYNPDCQNLTHEICTKFKDSIITHRESGASWDSITYLLKIATKAKINVNTVKKYAIKIIGTDPAPANKKPKYTKPSVAVPA